jgi:LysM repeat protein
MWKRVISDGAHGQLIEINTWGRAASDPDRVAGIYQVVHGLKPGAVYEFALSGLLREEAAHPGEDPFRYRVQWGYAPADGSPSADDITNWVELPWDKIYLRTDPGAMQSYSTRIQVPAKDVVIAIRAWKKWGTPQRELDVNLDGIRLSGCPGGSKPHPWPQPDPKPPFVCTHVVARGETLGKIAAMYGTTVEALAHANHLANPNLIYVGQKLVVPCAKPVPPIAILPPDPPAHPVHPIAPLPEPPPPDPSGPTCVSWHVVVRGDTLGKIAAQYGVSVAALTQANNLANPNVIRVSQKICIVQ